MISAHIWWQVSVCVYYMDRVLERLAGVAVKQLQLLAAACLSLAAKSRCEDEDRTTSPPVLTLQTLVLYADSSFTIPELKVIHIFDFNILKNFIFKFFHLYLLIL